MSEEIDSFQKRLDRLQNLNSIQGAGGGKRKGKAGGQAKLKPPESTDLLQSHGFLGVIDLIGEGPVDGFCLKDGTRATSSEILSSVFYNDTPIREDKSRFYLKKSIAPEDIQSMGKADKDGLTRGINNLIGNFEQFMGRQNIGVSFDSKAIIEVVPDNYKTVTRRVNYSSKKELEQAGASYGGYSGGYRGIKRTYYGYKNYYETRYTIRPFKALGLGYSNPFYLGFTVLYKNQNGKVIARRDLTPVNSLNKPSTYVTIDEMGRAESIVDPTRKNTNVFYGLVPVNVPPSRQTIVVRQIIREEDELSPSRRKLLNQAEETINNLNILKESIIENESIFDGRLGYIQYDVNRLVDLENETLYSDNATETIGFHLTDDNLYERFIKDNEAINTIQIPNGVVSVLPVIDEDDVITPQRGQIEDGFRIKEFFGGGLLFFYFIYKFHSFYNFSKNCILPI